MYLNSSTLQNQDTSSAKIRIIECFDLLTYAFKILYDDSVPLQLLKLNLADENLITALITCLKD